MPLQGLMHGLMHRAQGDTPQGQGLDGQRRKAGWRSAARHEQCWASPCFSMEARPTAAQKAARPAAVQKAAGPAAMQKAAAVRRGRKTETDGGGPGTARVDAFFSERRARYRLEPRSVRATLVAWAPRTQGSYSRHAFSCQEPQPWCLFQSAMAQRPNSHSAGSMEFQ